VYRVEWPTAGACRDFVLGARLLNAKGEHLRFGGEVMKNVAGYDIARLLAGSFGTLGLVTEFSIKVVPVPAKTLTLMLEMDQERALSTLRRWAGQPLPVSASSWFDGQLLVRLEGARAAVDTAVASLGGELVDDTAAKFFWRDLREQKHAFFAHAPVLWRLSVPAITGVLPLPERQWVEWGGAQRWCAMPQCSAQEAEHLRSVAAQAGGHATLFRVQVQIDTPQVPRFHPLAPALAAVHKRLKHQFDPAGVFNPGRISTDW
jgi:glycolate oxidase FAD binding subunit